MGELIRNLNEIHLGQNTFMLELNEGYSKSQGQTIHIQNKDFRYVLTKKDFLHLSAVILKAKSEMDFHKSREIRNLEQMQSLEYTEKKSDIIIEPEREVYDILERLKANDIDYRIIEHRKRLTTLIVKPEVGERAYNLINKTKGTKEIKHVFGIFFGYRFLYQMKPFKLYVSANTFIEVYSQLPCMSLTSKTWIPLDKTIQARVWTEKHVDSKGYYVIDNICYYIYRLAWAVFKKRKIESSDIEIFEKNRNVLFLDEFKQLMEKVFFKYTKELIIALSEKRYDKIILNYHKFSDY